MFYAITHTNGDDALTYYSRFVATWTTNFDNAIQFGSESAARERAALLSREWQSTVQVRQYWGESGTLPAPNKVIVSYRNGKPIS